MTARNLRWKGISTTNQTTTESDYTSADNWEPVSIRNSVYEWILSGSGTSNYYCRLTGGGDPGLVQPTNVQYNSSGSSRTNLTSGTAGSLAAGAWGYGNADALGYNTIYVRLPDSTDPDSKILDYVTFTDTPKATDHVRIPATSAYAITGTDQSSLAIGDFIVEDGYLKAIGSLSKPLVIDPDKFEFAGTGQSFIHLHSANISPKIINTGKAATNGTRGLNLRGTNIATIDMIGGDVGIATNHGEFATVSAVRVVGGKIYLGKNVTLTTHRQEGGESIIRCNGTNSFLYAGICTLEEASAWSGTITQEGGSLVSNTTGTINALTGSGGVADFTKSMTARTLTTYKMNPRHTILYDPGVLTITNRSAPDSPIKITGSPVV